MKILLIGNGKVNNVIKEIYKDLVIGFVDDTTVNIQEIPNIIIDFSHPVLLEKTFYYSMKYNIPVVIGTTGYDEEKMALIKEFSKSTPVLMSSNFSNGIMLIKKILKSNITNFISYKKTIIERHNSLKKDSPSGTAIMLGKILDTSNIYSYRDPFFIGEHDIVLENENEIVTISHKVLNRDVFAVGAVNAAFYLLNQPPGLYELEDMFSE